MGFRVLIFFIVAFVSSKRCWGIPDWSNAASRISVFRSGGAVYRVIPAFSKNGFIRPITALASMNRVFGRCRVCLTSWVARLRERNWGWMITLEMVLSSLFRRSAREVEFVAARYRLFVARFLMRWFSDGSE